MGWDSVCSSGAVVAVVGSSAPVLDREDARTISLLGLRLVDRVFLMEEFFQRRGGRGDL